MDDERVTTSPELPERQPTEKWRRLPERVRPEDTIEAVPQDRAPRDAAVLSDPETGWMLRYSA